ncbi:hypothetical protein BKA82DRAFT_4020964 [Pisolithus tinctorius]|nr:hypothetical protein BKA82DRAFT_4020964 [Pisolithus tinctorius]
MAIVELLKHTLALSRSASPQNGVTSSNIPPTTLALLISNLAPSEYSMHRCQEHSLQHPELRYARWLWIKTCGLFEGLAKEVRQVQGMLGASPTKHQGLGALDGSQRLGAFKSCLDKTPSDGGTTSYSTTQGVEDCQLSLATLESIFYFPKETQLFTLPAGMLIGILLLTFLLSWLMQHSHCHLLRLMVFRGYPQLCLLLLRQDSIHFACCYPQFRLLLLILESFRFALWGMFGASPTKCQGLGALGSSQRLGAFESHLGMDIP